MSIETCDKCSEPFETAHDAELFLDRFYQEYGDIYCRSCRDNRDERLWTEQQERLMEEGPDTSVKDRLDQELRNAGRGHLVRP